MLLLLLLFLCLCSYFPYDIAVAVAATVSFHVTVTANTNWECAKTNKHHVCSGQITLAYNTNFASSNMFEYFQASTSYM